MKEHAGLKDIFSKKRNMRFVRLSVLNVLHVFLTESVGVKKLNRFHIKASNTSFVRRKTTIDHSLCLKSNSRDIVLDQQQTESVNIQRPVSGNFHDISIS